MSDASASSALCILAREATLHTEATHCGQAAMPRVTHGRVARDIISVGGCTIVSGANSLQTRLINKLIAEHEVDGREAMMTARSA
jgi:hypothetical protein